jgi:endonuclease YncB( thermonuclease family)
MWLRFATLGFALALITPLLHSAASGAPARQPAGQRAEPPAPKPQPRPYGKRIPVAPAAISVDDGDTVTIRWTAKDTEIVRILGIDAPETRNPEHNLPVAQAFGPEARAFGQGAFAAATRIELLRAATLDPFGRTLGYLFLNGHNYSVLIVKARLAEESVSRYGDNGFPAEAAAVAAAAAAAGPLPFEPPGVYRGRMRELSNWLRERGDPEMAAPAR